MSRTMTLTMAMTMAMSPGILLGLLILCGSVWTAEGQVCSPPGQLCTRTTDCCRGCCEQYTCVERPYSCSADLKAIHGSSSCLNYHCPPDQICYLREVCPPESPCPMMPFCRTVASNYNNTPYYPRNSGHKNQSDPSTPLGLILPILFTFLNQLFGLSKSVNFNISSCILT